MPGAVALAWDLIAKDSASPAFLRVAGAADKAATATERAQKRTATASAAMARTGAKLTKALTLPLLGIAAVSVDQAAKWQKSMTLIQTAGGETAKKTAVLSKGLQKLAVETGTSLDQLGEGIYTIAKAGAQKWSATEQLKVMKAAAQGAKAEAVDLGTATEALSTVMLDYHAKAGEAVKYENMLIRASGLAKTSFGEFSKSLSNVVPIAAASGISLKEVGGAIATMTQHGVSAQQATENLRNLIFNLTGQNNVASQAMQQLGIDTVDLSKNLGKRGLTGTLAIVDKALAEHTKNGMVVIDVHKAAALATKSLSTMLGQMPKGLRAMSKDLLDNKVSINDYNKAAKSLGGQVGPMALQFLALYKNSMGFSNQLKAGKGAITTTTTQYQKMLGGMTGAAVAMQIAGKYAKENARNVREVGKAALETGSDVLGWNKTQETLSAKMDRAKASLQVLAVEIGTALIPAITKIVDKVRSAVEWFSNLSGTQKKIAVWAAGIAIAIGPLFAIGSKLITLGSAIGRFAGTTASNLAYLGGASITTASRVGTAMRGISAALGGAAIGAAVGTLTANSSTAVKAIGVLGSAAAGAAIGFGAGGPLGAAIGGITGGLTALATQFFGAGHAAKAAVAPTDDYTNAILADSDAIGKNTRKLVENNLQKQGLYDLGLKLGVSQRTLTDAALGNTAALTSVHNAQLRVAASGLTAWKNGKQLTQAQKDQAAASAKLDAGLGNVAQVLAVNKRAADNLAAADGKAAKAATGHAAAAAGAAAQVKNGTLGVITYSAALARLGQTNARPTITLAGTDEAMARLVAFQRQMGLLHDRTVHVNVIGGSGSNLVKGAAAKGTIIRGPGTGTSDTAGVWALSNGEAVIPAKAVSANRGLVHSLIAAGRGMASGGYTTVRGKGGQLQVTPTSGSGYSSGSSSSSSKSTVDQAALSSRASSAIGDIGSASTPKFSVADVGIARVRAQIKHAWDVLNTQIGKGLSSAAAAAFKKQIEAYTRLAARQLAALKTKVVGSDAAGVRQAGLHGTVADTRAAFGTLIGDARNAGASARTLKTMRADEAAIIKLQREGVAVANKLTSARARLADVQAKYNDTFSAVKESVSAFDITTAGASTQTFNDKPAAPASATSILGSIKKAAATAVRFASLLRKLTKDGLNKNLINQLALAGPSAIDQAIALSKATPKQFAQINSAYGTLQAAGADAGKTVATDMYGAGVSSAKGIIAGLKDQQSEINGEITRIANGMVRTLRGALKIHSPSKVMRWHGRMVGEGFRLGMVDKAAAIAGASGDYANAALPPSQQQSWRAGGQDHTHYHFHGIEDPAGIGAAVERRQYMRSRV